MKHLLIALIFLLLFCGVQTIQIFHYRNKIIKYERMIAQLKVDSEQWRKQYENAHQKAIDALFNSNKEVDTIMAADVSKNCTDAIAWGITQARRVS